MQTAAESAPAPTESPAVELLRDRCGDWLTSVGEENGELRLEATSTGFAELCTFLRDEPSLAFDYPADLCGRDTGEQIVLWYRLVSIAHNRTAIIHLALPREEPSVPSVTPIWPGMTYHERETFDLYGVRFPGHPDDGDPAQMRILLPEDWEGHPFRKDYEPVFSGNPLHGPQETN